MIKKIVLKNEIESIKIKYISFQQKFRQIAVLLKRNLKHIGNKCH